MVRRLVARAKRRGHPITDEVWSDAQWSLVQAAQGYRPERGSTWCSCAFPWVQGAIGRSLRRAQRHTGTESDPAARPTWEPNEERESQIKLIRLAIARMDSPLKEVAELRMEGLGIRRIAARLGRSFHVVREQYTETTESIARAIGYRWDEASGRLVTAQRALFEGI